jgi:hypothetical protein
MPVDDVGRGGACASCDTPLPRKATIRRRFCDDLCRTYARRDRLARQRFALRRRLVAAGPGGER